MSWAKMAMGAAKQFSNYDNMLSGAKAVGSWVNGSGLGMTVGSAVVGGVASYATGGGFLSGAMYGAVGGWAGYGAWRQKGQVRKFTKGMPYAGSLMKKALSPRVLNRTRATLGGAALGGAIFGNRRNRSRGFNSQRGSRM